MSEILKEELNRILETGEAVYEKTPPFIVFTKKKNIPGKRYRVYIFKDNHILRPNFGPLYNFFKLDIRDFAALFQAYAHGAKDAFRDFVLDFFEKKIQKRVEAKKYAYVIESHGTKRYNKSSTYFLKEVKIQGVKKWKEGIYLNSDPMYFFNWALQEDENLRLFYYGANGYALGKLTNQKLGELTTASLGIFDAHFEVNEYIAGIPIISLNS